MYLRFGIADMYRVSYRFYVSRIYSCLVALSLLPSMYRANGSFASASRTCIQSRFSSMSLVSPRVHIAAVILQGK